MVLLTAQDIATALLAATYSEPLNEISPYVVQDVSRREYPSIDIANVTGQERLRDVPTSEDKQIYEVRLYYRTTGFGDADEPNIKLLENEIFDVIDALQGTDSKITITESWKRQSLVVPTAHVLSTLRVVTEEIFSDIPGATLGDSITITFPNPLGVLDVIDLITDSLTAEKDLDLEMNTTSSEAEEIYTLKHLHGLLDVVVTLTTAQETQLDALFAAGDNISITLTKGATAFPKVANLITRTNSAPRSEVQKTTISMDII